jgi:nucleoside-diphosphate-sugar epimerase
MAPKLFLTGSTGYIGGDFLYLVAEKHPDWELTCLVRNSDKGAKIAAAYPKARLVYGDLDAVDVIEEEASKADIIYHFANCDHEASAKAITNGMDRRSSSSPGFWIHTSGTGILTWETFDRGCFGDELPKKFNDWDGVQELMNQPDHALHRVVDKIVIAAGSDKVKTAIVCPPTIYGPGRGPDNQKSMQAYKAAAAMMKIKQGFVVGKGVNVWHQVHVQDLSDLYLLLGEAAATGGPPATWNEQGYYLAENGEFVWGDVLKAIAKDAHSKGLLPQPTTKGYSADEAQAVLWFGHYAVGSNSRGESIRGKRLLGWKPYRPLLMEEVPTIVDIEARALGLTQGHAAKVQS